LPHLLTGLLNSHAATLTQPSVGTSTSEESPFLSSVGTWISSSLLFFQVRSINRIYGTEEEMWEFKNLAGEERLFPVPNFPLKELLIKT